MKAKINWKIFSPTLVSIFVREDKGQSGKEATIGFMNLAFNNLRYFQSNKATPIVYICQRQTKSFVRYFYINK